MCFLFLCDPSVEQTQQSWMFNHSLLRFILALFSITAVRHSGPIERTREDQMGLELVLIFLCFGVVWGWAWFRLHCHQAAILVLS